MKLDALDLYSIYRQQGRSVIESIKLAWQYRNFVPDHSDSHAMRAQMSALEREAQTAYNRVYGAELQAAPPSDPYR